MASLLKQILKFRGYPIEKAMKQIALLHKMSGSEFNEWKEKKKWEIVRFHYDNNQLYKRLVGSKLPDRWEDLPIVTKRHLQRELKEIITEDVQPSDCYTGSTSGSTGQPFFFAKDKMAHAMTWAIIANRYNWYGIHLGAKQARFYGMPKEPLIRQTERIKDALMNRERFSVFDLSDNVLDHFLKRFKSNKYVYLYGYTSALVMFARYLSDKGVVLKEVCPTLKLCIATSETCTPEDKTALEAGFGVSVVREYGLSETCFTAFDNPDGYWQLTEETIYTEIVNEEYHAVSGRQGKVLSTSLFNKALPMIRYETGDIGAIDIHHAKGYKYLKEFTGRTNDVIILPSGKKAAGLTFYYISRSVLELSGVLKEFIIRQTHPDRFVFDIVADRELTKAETELVKDKISLYLEPGLKIVMNRVDRIERSASGKLQHFYSELDKD